MKAQDPTIHRAAASGEPVQLPQDWPVTALTFPKGSKRAKWPTSHKYGKDVDPYCAWLKSYDSDDKILIVGFDGEFSWDELVDHVDSELLPIGYSQQDYRPVKKGYGEINAYKDYTSSDGMIDIEIGYKKYPKNVINDGCDCYYYQITVKQPSG